MIRKVITIDQEKCNGCGLCVKACHEGAIGLIDGKAQLLRDDYCDGLGDCLPACPMEAITFEEREAAAYDAAAVQAAMQQKNRHSELLQWPVQIKLMPIKAPFYQGAQLLIAADCTAYAHANFHQDFMKGRVTLIGCPKLDAIDYAEKLTAILRENEIQSVTVLRMKVPCCGGLELAVKRAIRESGKRLPWQVVTVNTDGSLRE